MPKIAFIIYPAIYILTICYLTNGERLKICYNILKVLCIGMACYGFLQYIGWLPSGNNLFTVTGTFDNPAGIGMFLAILFPYVIYEKWAIIKYGQIIQWIATFLVITVLILCGSRTGILAACAGIYCLYANKINRKYTIVLILLGILACAVLYLYKPVSANGRLFIDWISIRLAIRHLWLGYGLDGFDKGYMLEQAAFFTQHPTSAWAQVADNVRSPFNEYILFFIRFGLAGIAFIIGIGLLFFRQAKRNYCVQKRPAIASLSAAAICGCFSYPSYYIPIILVVTITLGVLYAPFNRQPAITLKRSFTIIIAGIILTTGLLEYGYNYYYYEHPRMQVETRSADGEESEDLDLTYYVLYQTDYFKSHAVFLYNYTLHLYENEQFSNALPVIKQYFHYRHDYDGQMIYAYTLKHLSQTEQSIEAFHLASSMLPGRLQPRYELMCLYDQTGNKSKALNCAKEALKIPAKVSNLKTEHLQNEFRHYISSTNAHKK